MKIKGIILKDSEREALLTLKNILATKFNLLDFRIFGSKVRGDAIHESDINVMIELDEINSPDFSINFIHYTLTRASD